MGFLVIVNGLFQVIFFQTGIAQIFIINSLTQRIVGLYHNRKSFLVTLFRLFQTALIKINATEVAEGAFDAFGILEFFHEGQRTGVKIFCLIELFALEKNISQVAKHIGLARVIPGLFHMLQRFKEVGFRILNIVFLQTLITEFLEISTLIHT